MVRIVDRPVALDQITPDRIVRDHDYNDPNISATDFLTAVMRDRAVPLSQRVDAATYLMRLPEPPPAVVTLRIEGGVPVEPEPARRLHLIQ
jgi:hypothetical protein